MYHQMGYDLEQSDDGERWYLTIRETPPPLMKPDE